MNSVAIDYAFKLKGYLVKKGYQFVYADSFGGDFWLFKIFDKDLRHIVSVTLSDINHTLTGVSCVYEKNEEYRHFEHNIKQRNVLMDADMEKIIKGLEYVLTGDVSKMKE